MVDHHLVANGNCHQTKGKRPKFIGSQFSLSVYDITANEMSDTCHGHLVANGNSLQEGVGGSISLVQRINPCYINGGHSEGYIRNTSLGSVSKIANLSIFHSLILIHLDNHIFQGSLHQSLQVGMFYIIDCFSGLGVNIGSLIARVAYGFSYSHWNTVGVTAGPSQWQNRVGAY